jgi:Tubulin like
VLQKFFFVGVGGSGGVTLRMLRALLASRLVDAGYRGGIPAAWQFAHIDVPLLQETRPEDVPPLPDNNYAGLAARGLKYRDLDDEVVKRRGRQAQIHVAGWRPDPTKVHVDPTVGAGRFRAVGRMILGARLEIAYHLLRTGFANMSSAAANQEFSRVCLALTRSGQFAAEETQVVVVSSLAGGTGAGTVIDICDLVMQLQPHTAEDRLTTMLYTPEVFDELDPMDKDGTNPNALAALAELLNGYWIGEAPTEEEFALISSAGAFTNHGVRRRGPRVMYLIGRSNGDVTFPNQIEVYRAVAKGLAVLATSPALQNRFRTQELGNWHDRAIQGEDTSGLCGETDERPFSSFGFASVGIGLDRFARYASERLARDAIDHLLTGHWSQQQRDAGITEQQARELRAGDVFRGFLQGARLEEDGPYNNDVVDAIRGRTEAEARRVIAGDLQESVLGEVTRLWPANAGADRAGTRIVERMTEHWHDSERYQREYLANATQWADELQHRLAAGAARLVATEGAPVGAEAIQRCVEQILNVVVPELEASRDVHHRVVGELRSKVKGSLAGISGTLRHDNPRIAQAVAVALDSFHAHTEEFVYDLAVELLRDVAENLLQPLYRAIRNAGQRLQIQLTGTPIQPPRADKWSTAERTVPSWYEPPPNELVLEPVAGYPAMFESQVCGQVGEPIFRNALLRARREIIEGIRARADGQQVAVEARGRWQPRDKRLPQSSEAQPGEFVVYIDDEQLLNRSVHWIRRPDTAMGNYLRQTLTDYLDRLAPDDEQRALRCEMFRRELAQAVVLSRPLVKIDRPKLGELHPGRQDGFREVLTKFPFERGHPGRDAVASVFSSLPPEELDQLFGGDPCNEIHIFTFLSAPVQPVVMASFVDPIRRQWDRDRRHPGSGGFWTWRRARPLPNAVPCTPEVRKAIVRGWFAARFLRQVRCANDDITGNPTEVWSAAGWLELPWPLLGLPRRRWEVDDWMPAVLESMCLTLVGVPFDAYGRLAELGRAVEDGTGELHEWVAYGRLPAGAPLPDETLAGPADGSAGQRAKALCARVDHFEAHFARYDAWPLRDREPRGAWELRDDIRESLSDIRQAVLAAVNAHVIRLDESAG